MTLADRLIFINRWYDGVPEDWRGHIVLWPLVGAGFINMQLSIFSRFPFGILVLLVVLAFAAIRVPYVRGWLVPGAEGSASLAQWRLDGLYNFNTRYDDLPELKRFLVVPAFLIAVGGINMWLTLAAGWVFGGLFLIALLVVIAVRAPYVWGLLAPTATRAQGPLFGGAAYDVNVAFDRIPRERRFLVLLVGVAVALLIDLWLTHGRATMMLLLVVIEFLAVFLLRSPYLAGRYTPPAAPSGATGHLTHDPLPPLHVAAAPIPDPDPAPHGATAEGGGGI